MTDIVVPTLGESVTEATVGKWLKTAGDAVAKDDVLVELETDKVAVEVSAEAAGTLSEIVASEGDTVEIGALLGRLGGANGATASAPAAAASAPAPAVATPAASGGSDAVEVTVPSMGESVAEGTIGAFLKQVGDSVSKDETIAEIARRGGVIGINLYSRFLTTNPPPARAQLRDVIAHIEHICTITGSKAHVALGSDADGGFPATRLPEGINQARDYPRLAESLRNAGWNDEEIAGFCSENWLRFWRGD